jgi:hypothetical protein
METFAEIHTFCAQHLALDLGVQGPSYDQIGSWRRTKKLKEPMHGDMPLKSKPIMSTKGCKQLSVIQ